jgi:hypothetical protein
MLKRVKWSNDDGTTESAVGQNDIFLYIYRSSAGRGLRLAAENTLYPLRNDGAAHYARSGNYTATTHVSQRLPHTFEYMVPPAALSISMASSSPTTVKSFFGVKSLSRPVVPVSLMRTSESRMAA